jgi:hypothetical protein
VGEIEALCGTLDVYENRETREDWMIGLNVVVLPALSDVLVHDPDFDSRAAPACRGRAASSQFPRSREGVLVRGGAVDRG